MKVKNYITQDERVKPVPYGPDFRSDSLGYGFVDLKDNPDRVTEIVEARDLPGLQRLLRFFASRDSPFFSIGCEKAVSDQGGSRFAVGGYVEFAFNFPTLAHFENYEMLQKGFEKKLVKARVSGLQYFEWKVSPIDLSRVKIRMMSCTVWIGLSELPSKDLAAKRYDEALRILASYFEGIVFPPSPQGQIFGGGAEGREVQ